MIVISINPIAIVSVLSFWQYTALAINLSIFALVLPRVRLFTVRLLLFNVNPAMFWHNTYEVGLNVTLGFDVEALVGAKKNVRVYGEFLLDDVKTAVEEDGNPHAFGLSLGVEWHLFDNEEIYLGANFDYDRNTVRERRATFTQSGLRLGFQAIWATPYLYSRADDDPLGKLTFHNQLQLGVGHWSVLENYIGFTYGPDTILLELQANYLSERWKIDGAFGMLFWGKHGSSNSGFCLLIRDLCRLVDF